MTFCMHRSWRQEMLAEEIQPSVGHRDVDVDDLLDDPELERLHAERLAAMHKEAEKRAALQRKGHGELQEVGPAWHPLELIFPDNTARSADGHGFSADTS